MITPSTQEINMRTTEGLTDEQIEDRACQELDCRNWAARGVIYCERCLHGSPSPMPKAIADRKITLEDAAGMRRAAMSDALSVDLEAR